MPNPLLARYFHARGVFDDLDIAVMPEPQPEALWAAWLTLDATQRHAMDAAFQDIAALSGEKGYRAILDDAAWHLATDPAAHAAFVEQLASLEHHGARAMTTFLDHPACWQRATLESAGIDPGRGDIVETGRQSGRQRTDVCMLGRLGQIPDIAPSPPTLSRFG